MGIFSQILKREDPLVTTPPITVVATKKTQSKKTVQRTATKRPKPKATPKRKPAAKKAGKRGPRRDYKGDVHWVVDLEGIGPTYSKRLQDNGIKHTQQLLFASDARLQKLSKAPAKTVQNWKHMSQLVKIDGIGPQFAELLVRSGVDGVDGLKNCDIKPTVKQILDYTRSLDSNVTGSGIGEKRLKDWQGQAKKMRKVPIDMKTIVPVELGSREAQAAPRKTPAKKKAPAKPKQVTRNGYLLYKSGPRYFFSKKKAPQKGWRRINKVPAGFKVQTTKTGLPVLARK